MYLIIFLSLHLRRYFSKKLRHRVRFVFSPWYIYHELTVNDTFQMCELGLNLFFFSGKTQFKLNHFADFTPDEFRSTILIENLSKPFITSEDK